MRRRARDLTTRARERIRAAREHDPHAWNHHDGDGGPEPIDFVEIPPDEEDDEPADGATRPPLGSPEPGAPDVTGGGGGISGPPDGGRPQRPPQRGRRAAAPRRTGAEDDVPFGLRTAAA